MFYIYEIVGPTGIYVGKSKNYVRRWSDHVRRANAGSGTYFHNALRKYGKEAFAFSVVCTSQEESYIFDCERQIISQHIANGTRLYNLTLGGEGPAGKIVSEETRAKISAANKGRKFSAQHKAKIGEANSRRVQTPETREKLRATKLGKKLSADHRAKIAAGGMGRKASPESTAKTVAFHTGRKRSDETRASMRYGRKVARDKRIIAEMLYSTLAHFTEATL